MKRKLLIALIIFGILYILPLKALAQSTYVLPYPSVMPGNKFYLLERVAEEILQYWYFGDFAKFTYHLSYADKYLVESKILFEYGQYALAVKSLERSNMYFIRLESDLDEAATHGKDISEKSIQLTSAKDKHKEILEEIVSEVPVEVLWTEENKPQQLLKLHHLLDKSIMLRV